MKILDENGQDFDLKMKKGVKYQIKFDLEDSLTSNCQEKNPFYKILNSDYFFKMSFMHSHEGVGNEQLIIVKNMATNSLTRSIP